eukprot:2816585-Pleurochrysis_carterae.AAC.1
MAKVTLVKCIHAYPPLPPPTPLPPRPPSPALTRPSASHLRRDVLDHRQVVLCRAQILAERQHIDVCCLRVEQ